MIPDFSAKNPVHDPSAKDPHPLRPEFSQKIRPTGFSQKILSAGQSI